MNFYERKAANRRRTVQLIACHAVAFLVLGLGLDALFLGFPSAGPGFPVITPIAVGLSLVTSAFAYYRGDKALLDSLLAQPIRRDDPEQRQLENIVREISIAAGIPVPAVFVIPDRAPNALATGRDPEHASIALTSGALALFDREETQGVIAHEVAHIASGDTAVMMLGTVLYGGIAILSDWGRRMFHFSRMPTPMTILLAVPMLLLAAFSPILSKFLSTAVSRQRELHADAVAVELTRNPHGLSRALRKIARTRSPLRGASRGTAHLFIVNPLKRRNPGQSDRWSESFASHPPLHHRIGLLEGRYT